MICNNVTVDADGEPVGVWEWLWNEMTAKGELRTMAKGSTSMESPVHQRRGLFGSSLTDARTTTISRKLASLMLAIDGQQRVQQGLITVSFDSSMSFSPTPTATDVLCLELLPPAGLLMRELPARRKAFGKKSKKISSHLEWKTATTHSSPMTDAHVAASRSPTSICPSHSNTTGKS